MRAFVAVDVPGPPGARAEERAPAHFTLLFLSDLPEGLVGPLAEAIGTRVAREPPFRLAFGPVGAFPDATRPRVVYLSVSQGAAELGRLALAAREAADAVGVRYDARPFVPHFTILRVRGERDRERARSLLEGPLVGGPAPFVVDRLLLKESRIDRTGPTHSVRASLPLAGDRDAG